MSDTVTNTTSVAIGKIDHICMKVEGYNSFLTGELVNIMDHNSCRFGSWFNHASKTILENSRQELSTIAEEHKKVHSCLQSAVSIFNDNAQNNSQGAELMERVEAASKKSFEVLLSVIKRTSH